MATTMSGSGCTVESLVRAQVQDGVTQPSIGTIIGIPFHGSCSRCHHFHRDHLLTFSLNSNDHTRLECQECQHPMFGLGRTSTQTTLASVETGYTPNTRICAERPQPQSGLHVETSSGSSNHRPCPSPQGALTPIAEQNSLRRSRSTSNVVDPTSIELPGNVIGAGIGPLSLGDQRFALPNLPYNAPGPGYQHVQPVLWRRMRTIRDRFRKRLCNKPRAWDLSRLGIRVIIQPSDTPPAALPHKRPVTDDGGIRVPTDALSTPPASQTAAFGVTSSAAGPSVASVQNEPELPNVAVDTTNRNSDLRSTDLKAVRCQRTADREAALQSRCECNPDCFCKSGGSRASNRVDVGDGSNILLDNGRTLPSSEVPGYILGYHSSSGSSSQPSQGDTQEVPFSFIGHQFDVGRRSSSAEHSSSTAGSSQRRDRLSQNSTLWNGSTNSLIHGRRPLSVGRSASLPVVYTRYPSAGPDRGRFQAQPHNGDHRDHLSAFERNSGTQSMMPEGTTSHGTGLVDSDHRDIAGSSTGRTSPHANSTSFAEPYEHQDDQQLVNGTVTPPTNGLPEYTPMTDGEDDTPTQRLSSQIDDVPPQLPLPDGVSDSNGTT